TVDRPRVPHPTRTTSSVYCLHLIPGIENLSDEQLQDIFSVLKNRMMLDDLIARPAEACGREYFVTPRFPEILCTLWMLCQAYLNIPTCHPGARDPAWWMAPFVRTKPALATTHELRSATLDEWRYVQAAGDVLPLVRLIDALAAPDLGLSVELVE